MEAIFSWRDEDEKEKSLWPDRILAARPFNIDLRIAVQRGCFTFHPPRQPWLDVSHTSLRRFRIPVFSGQKLRKELELLGVDEFTMYGDLDNLAHRLKRAYLSDFG